MVEDFDIAQVHQLVDGALSAPSARAVPAGLDARQVHLMATFYRSLDQGGVGVDARVAILAQIRSELRSFAGRPDPAATARAVRACRACPDAVAASGATLMGNTKDPEWIFVVSNPADNLALLKSTLSGVGFDLARVGLSFITRCDFSGKVGPAAAANCVGYLLDELHFYQPRIVVPVGSAPARVLLGDDLSISKLHGQSYWIDSLHVVPVLSPAHAERAHQGDGLRRDLEYILTVA